MEWRCSNTSSLEEKGWTVKVAFKQCQHGIGLFADCGTIIRKSQTGKTQAVFYEKDFENFSDKTIEYLSHYAKDNTDDRHEKSIQIDSSSTVIWRSLLLALF